MGVVVMHVVDSYGGGGGGGEDTVGALRYLGHCHQCSVGSAAAYVQVTY